METEFSSGKKKVLSKTTLANGLQEVIGLFDFSENWILKQIFPTFYKNFETIVSNLKSTGKSDMLISYGNNNYVTKIFLSNIFKENHKNVKILNFNSFIQTSEDYILKRICRELGIDTERPGFDSAQRAIEDYYENYDKNDDTILVIFFENIEHLFAKKKQVLFYTLLEIVNFSKNLFFCGLTANFNLVELMEKRNRSRFSQKTIFLTINNFETIINALENSFLKVIDKMTSDRESLSDFYENLIRNETFILMIDKYVNLGLSVKEILIKIKFIMTLIQIEFNLKLNTEKMFIEEEYICDLIDIVVKNYDEEERLGSYFNLLKSKNIINLDFPKLHILLIICLLKCGVIYKEKITIGMIYHEYSEYTSPKFNGLSKLKLDVLVIKKALEELANSNLITIKNDEKYIHLYELKNPNRTTLKILDDIIKNNYCNHDSDMVAIINTLRHSIN